MNLIFKAALQPSTQLFFLGESWDALGAFIRVFNFVLSSLRWEGFFFSL